MAYLFKASPDYLIIVRNNGIPDLSKAKITVNSYDGETLVPTAITSLVPENCTATSSGNVATITGVSGTIGNLRINMIASGETSSIVINFDVLSGNVIAKNQKTISRLEDGYTIRLAPPAIVIPADASGNNPVLTSAKSRVFLEKAGVNIPVTIQSVAGTGCNATFLNNEIAINSISAQQGAVQINFKGDDGYLASTQVSFTVSKQGDAGYSVILDNETHTVPALADGSFPAGAFDGAKTKILVFKGKNPLTPVAANAIPGPGQFRYNATTSGGTANRVLISGQDTNNAIQLVSMSADKAVISLNIYVESMDNVFTKQMTITKVKEGQKGEDGTKGDKGALPLFRGEYNKDEYGNPEVRTYYGTAQRSDIVMHGGAYYFAKETAGVFNNISPTDPGQTKWEPFGSQVSSIATGLLLAQMSYIENLVVRNIRTAGEFGNPNNTGGRRFELTSKDNANNPNMFRFAIDAADINPAWSTGNPDNSLNLMEARDNMETYDDNGTTRQLAGMKFNKYFAGVYGNPDYVRVSGNGIYSNASAASTLLGANTGYAALIGYLRRQQSSNLNDINAGVIGMDGVGGSNCYAGYFKGKFRVDGELQLGDKTGLDTTIQVNAWKQEAGAFRTLRLTYKGGVLVERYWES